MTAALEPELDGVDVAHLTVSRTALDIATERGLWVLWDSPTNAFAVEPFDIVWTLPDGSVIILDPENLIRGEAAAD